MALEMHQEQDLIPHGHLKKEVSHIDVECGDLQSKSSNFRELYNLVETLEHLESTDDLFGSELFIFTDNSVAEAAFYKGNSSSKLLFDLVLRFTILQSNCKMKFHIIHVAGTRMIQQGSDGLSRGNMLEGVMKGDDILSHVPIHKSALNEQDNLEEWIRAWAPDGDNAIVLEPNDWFERGHDIAGYTKNLDGVVVPAVKGGTYIWSPPLLQLMLLYRNYVKPGTNVNSLVMFLFALV